MTHSQSHTFFICMTMNQSQVQHIKTRNMANDTVNADV